MKKPSGKQKLLDVGLRLFHSCGFAGASVRDITQAADMPLGSFTNHFVSKEAFGIEVLDLYLARYRELIRATVQDESISPLMRLAAFVDSIQQALEEGGWQNGCMIGNFSAEVSEKSEVTRLRLQEIYVKVRDRLEECLQAAVAVGELKSGTDCRELADFFFESLQGAILRTKVERGPSPMARFKTFMFAYVLR